MRKKIHENEIILKKGRKIQIARGMAESVMKTRVLSRKWDLTWMKMMKMTYSLCLRPGQSLALDA